MGAWDKVRKAFGSGGTGIDVSPRDMFARDVEAAIREVPSVTSVRRGLETFELLVTRGNEEQIVLLDSVFAETRDMNPEQRRERIARLARSVAEPDPAAIAWDAVRPKLAPLLRTTALFGGGPGVGDRLPIHRPFAPFLIECVGIDSEDGIRYAAPYMVAKWGVQASDVFAAARESGRASFTGDVESYDSRAPYPLWHVARDDSYESSRLLIPGWLATFAGRVIGRPVAIVPHRSLLIVGGDGDEACLKRLVESARAEFEGSPRRVSPALYTVDDESNVVPLVLPSEHRLSADVRGGHVMLAVGEYETQKQQLDRDLKEDVFIASCQGVQDSRGNILTYTTWAKGVSSLLPRTDQVVLGLNPGKKGGEVLRVPWPALMDIAGDCLVRERDVDPPRWRTKGWPDENAIARLRRKAVP